ncbi:cupredoxin domain-containing protein [Halocatena pleomorpha]|uniref:Halocyanin n=1 Tax=Halocatena pleomorpha TaxID=1785090 RepID=A0A3P3RGF4_9EURY|nr:plastocyanin/azurin family copper-binding protein [Halocatena pleomorpha]RRJ31979.1 halocyanin [Halocatena pleomorpha]
MDRRAFLATAAGLTSATLAGCFASGSLSATEYDIGMASNAFTPDHYTTSVGETVVWGNTNSRAHSVTAYENAIPDEADYFASGGFDTTTAARESWREHNGRDGGKILTGQTYSHTFEVPGTYSYFCIPHEKVMTGVIVVEEKK